MLVDAPACPPRRRRRVSGFSLIELMVVIAIMGLLATVVAVSLSGKSYEAKVHKVQADFSNMKTAIDLFYNDCSAYPRQLSDLWQNPGLKKWHGPYLQDAPPAPVDPWGGEYQMGSGNGVRKYDLISFGSDNNSGGVGEAQDLDLDNVSPQNIDQTIRNAEGQ